MTADEAIDLMGEEAWTDAETMEVLSTHLLELGVVQGMTEDEAARQCRGFRPFSHTPEDEALYRLEAEVRGKILARHADKCRVLAWDQLNREWREQYWAKPAHPELRVTGGWPDILFVITDGPSHPTSHLTLAGVREQPRLLRPTSK